MPALATVKDCVTQASLEIGIIQRPITTLINSQDADIVQMTALLSAVADEVLLDEHYKVTLGDGVWLYTEDGTPKSDISADNDRIGFDARLAIDGLKYRFLQAKGLEYGEAMRDFLNRLNKLAGRMNAKVLDLYEGESRSI
jgi:hypothetical protein